VAGAGQDRENSLAGNRGEVKHIGLWIEQLNHDAYPVRQAAAEQLLDAGMPARGPLLEVADGPDPETRAAARRLVALIDRTEFHRRLDAFARDEDGRQGLTLPGWDVFRERIGDDTSARALFVDMQRQEGGLLAAVFGASPTPLDGIWEERLMRLVQWQATSGDPSGAPPLGTCATMLFLGAVPELAVSERGAVLVESLIQRPPLRENVQTGNYRDAVRRLVVNWVMHCPNQNEAILNRRLYLASMNQLHESLPLAFDIALGDDKYSAVQPPTRAAPCCSPVSLAVASTLSDSNPSWKMPRCAPQWAPARRPRACSSATSRWSSCFTYRVNGQPTTAMSTPACNRNRCSSCRRCQRKTTSSATKL
jgi:hypothetical protein